MTAHPSLHPLATRRKGLEMFVVKKYSKSGRDNTILEKWPDGVQYSFSVAEALKLTEAILTGNEKKLEMFLNGVSPEGKSAPCAHDGWRFPLTMPLDSRILVGGFGKTHGPRQEMTKRGSLPAWFFKGTDASLLLNGEEIERTSAARQICEEGEIVLLYYINNKHKPIYIGYTFGNDVTDIATARETPAKLGRAKLYSTPLCHCLFVGPPPNLLRGEVSLYRKDKRLGYFPLHTGIDELVCSIDDLTSDLFSTAPMLIPGVLHLVFIGCPMNTYDAHLEVHEGDQISIEFETHKVLITNRFKK